MYVFFKIQEKKTTIISKFSTINNNILLNRHHIEFDIYHV